MQKMSNIILWLIVQRVWIALGCVGLLIFSYRVAGVSVSSSLTVLAFLGTWFAYSMQLKFSKFQWFSPTSPWPLMAKYGFVVAVLVSTLGVWLLWSWPVLAWLWGFSMPSVFYGMKLSVGEKKLDGLRSIPRAKIILISLVWTSIAMLPWVQWQHFQEFETWVYAVMVFCFVMMLTIPFDVRDKMLDQPTMKTMGQSLDFMQNRWIMLVLALVAARSGFFLVEHHIISMTLWSLFLAIQGMSLVLAMFAMGKKSIWMYECLLDGMLILLGLAYWLY